MNTEITNLDFYFLKDICLTHGIETKREYDVCYSVTFSNIKIIFSIKDKSKNEYIYIKDTNIHERNFYQTVLIFYYSVKMEKVFYKKNHYKRAIKNNYDFTNINDIYNKMLLNRKLKEKLIESSIIIGVKKI